MNESIPTPKISKSIDFLRVYEPAEDTFILLDSLEKELTSLTLNKLNPKIALEVGVGSGIPLIFLGQLLKLRQHEKKNSTLLIGTDLNPLALEATKLNGKENEVTIELIQTDLITGFTPHLTRKVDILLFNPPYVVTKDDEVFTASMVKDPQRLMTPNSSEELSVLDSILAATWAGGTKGRRVTDQFLKKALELLSDTGLLFLVLIKENLPLEVLGLVKKMGYDGEIAMERKAGRERLYILKIWRKMN